MKGMYNAQQMAEYADAKPNRDLETHMQRVYEQILAAAKNGVKKTEIDLPINDISNKVVDTLIEMGYQVNRRTLEKQETMRDKSTKKVIIQDKIIDISWGQE